MSGDAPAFSGFSANHIDRATHVESGRSPRHDRADRRLLTRVMARARICPEPAFRDPRWARRVSSGRRLQTTPCDDCAVGETSYVVWKR